MYLMPLKQDCILKPTLLYKARYYKVMEALWKAIYKQYLTYLGPSLSKMDRRKVEAALVWWIHILVVFGNHWICVYVAKKGKGFSI